uniref:Uncharacterized protein n=1 Tax=Haptolina brevifila TaxID=156173 RepID=A0A7S2JGN5_9EUKA|mmetsp:Transcript_81326/g.161731  ORF Transcript_81326/g.161731 Transcript_81326/m.161731 type:complete len:193 (+) Transcript_81326:383-961(+)
MVLRSPRAVPRSRGRPSPYHRPELARYQTNPLRAAAAQRAEAAEAATQKAEAATQKAEAAEAVAAAVAAAVALEVPRPAATERRGALDAVEEDAAWRSSRAVAPSAPTTGSHLGRGILGLKGQGARGWVARGWVEHAVREQLGGRARASLAGDQAVWIGAAHQQGRLDRAVVLTQRALHPSGTLSGTWWCPT